MAARGGRRHLLAGLLGAGLALAGSAHGHGFGARYDLPLPLPFYLVGAGLTVTLTFVMLALFMRRAPRPDRQLCLDLSGTPWARLLAACRLLAAALFVLVLAAGLFGAQNPLKNIAPVMVWAIWWIGMAYLSALLGNLWALLNPLDNLFAWAQSLYARLRPGRRLSLGLAYPQALGAWPAVLLFLAFAWLELVWTHSDSPAHLAAAMLAYAALTWLGMLLFGRKPWLRHGEVFSLVFGLLARFAPAEAVRTRNGPALRLRPYGVGLLTPEPVPVSIVALVLAMLAVVCFDGLKETPPWAALLERFAAPADAADTRQALLQSAGLLGTALLFATLYLGCCRLIAHCARTREPLAHTAGRYVLTLVPIAIAYHLAHYLSFLVMAWQYLIPLASDPFGFGWDLFGTRNHFVRIGLLDARAVWYIAVGAIVLGHVAAVYLAHCVALRSTAGRQEALRSQWPMLALMVAYSMSSLWIIAQPIVNTD